MNIYLVSRTDYIDYDQYNSFVVIANNEEEARNTQPTYKDNKWDCLSHSWVRKDKISSLKVELIGTASPDKQEREVVLASFNAG